MPSPRAIVRRATTDDNRAMCDLFARVDMRGDVHLSVTRDPDFDALYRMQSATWESWVVELNGAVEGMGTVLVRDGYLDGQPCRIGYLGDLRFSPCAEGRQLLHRFYGPILESAARRLGCDVFLTSIIESNTRAVRALTAETHRATSRPRYVPLRRFAIRAVHLTTLRMQSRTAVMVRTATAGDIAVLSAFLDADARRRPFGYPCGRDALEQRLATWPGLTVSSFYLAETPAGELVGCVAAWDAAAVKRMLVRAYRGRMRRTRVLYNVAATIGGFPRLPSPEHRFRYVYLTHQAIPTEDPSIMRALLEAVYRDHRGTGYHFVSCCVYDTDPLAPAYRGFSVTDLPASLYLVTPPGGAALDPRWAEGRPGFEMALV